MGYKNRNFSIFFYPYEVAKDTNKNTEFLNNFRINQHTESSKIYYDMYVSRQKLWERYFNHGSSGKKHKKRQFELSRREQEEGKVKIRNWIRNDFFTTFEFDWTTTSVDDDSLLQLAEVKMGAICFWGGVFLFKNLVLPGRVSDLVPDYFQ